MIAHDLLVGLIQEIMSDNILDCYKNAVGGFPPIISIEPEAAGEPYWPFVWQSKRFNRAMYLKFVIVHDTYLYLSLHPDRK